MRAAAGFYSASARDGTLYRYEPLPIGVIRRQAIGECDMVEHCGGVKQSGNFVHTLTLTDIHSGWTECAALTVREQSLVVEGIGAVSQRLPFVLRGLDTDNDSAFMNETLQGYCNQHRIEWTRQ